MGKTAIQKMKWIAVKQRGKLPVIANKEGQNLPAVIFILLFLKFLLSHLTGKNDAERKKAESFLHFFMLCSPRYSCLIPRAFLCLRFKK